MCLVLLALHAHPRFPLVVAANRDEFYERPTRPAAWWDDAPDVLAGRDLRGGGTWMGISRAGRWAAVTNYRDPRAERRDAPSRGTLVADFLRGRQEPARYVERLAARAAAYNGFNLLVGDRDATFWISNRSESEPAGRPLGPGVYGLSNHLLDTPWPKVVRGRRALADALARPDPAPGPLLDLLLDRTLAADHLLPDTGVGADLERALSPAFILSPAYGTRASTALLLDRDGAVSFVERTFRPGSLDHTEARFDFLTKS